jgi:hypothetical protein
MPGGLPGKRHSLGLHSEACLPDVAIFNCCKFREKDWQQEVLIVRTSCRPKRQMLFHWATQKHACTILVPGYDYGAVLGMSWLFYEAQRSGLLPSSSRVAWRGPSALGDKAPDGSDVSGGWYDAGGE